MVSFVDDRHRHAPCVPSRGSTSITATRGSASRSESGCSPTPLPDPVLVHFNADAAALIDLDPAEAARPEFLRHASGAEPIPGSDPVAMLYAGHQFGSFVPQLGDGRAILLGEVVNARGERWDLHLKGSGPTPFSRGFDGRSVLRSAIREYLCGEALHALGIPTTRALCIVGSPEPVRRETVETAASIIRMAPTHVRIGSFEVFASRGQEDFLRTLADYTIELHFPELIGLEDRYARMLETVSRRTASLMAQWQAVGFTHGVMNTDNFSITGLTIDYGPYAFMEAFEGNFIPNHSDPEGRYAYSQQPAIGQWNVSALAQALLPLMPREQAVAAFDTYVPAWEEAYARVMRDKLGLETAQPGDDTAPRRPARPDACRAGRLDDHLACAGRHHARRQRQPRLRLAVRRPRRV